ncbi:Gfo/Idh/MocA family protein [Shimia biformata]|uniref:Gfo/Idh/MocA family protein n=1 Tax=Shimia biformata TaxID=1294299 RepID=UPI00194E2B12|nr:Gfo/Idh/MocA family oxidoreductase [Shimia biformata]
MKRSVSIIGCGFVADLYMASLKTFPDVAVACAFDRDPVRMAAFCAHWGIAPAADINDLLARTDGIVLNLTNPASHYGVNKACLEAGRHVYCEKPLAMEFAQAQELAALAREKGVMLSSAPCSLLGEAAQMFAKAVRDGVAGDIRLVYVELDDGFIPQAPYQSWTSESGAPWPAGDEFAVGCTLEHAGYYLGWMIGTFGSVRRVVAASAEVLPMKEVTGTPDVSVATLFFESGLVARLTCSIVAPHDHRIRAIGDKGVISVNAAWDNGAKVKFRHRLRLRRRLLESPIAQRIKPGGATHPKVKRRGAASMNFALGPVEMLDAMAENRPCRLSVDLGLHMTEVTLAIQNAGDKGRAQDMSTRCDPIDPMPWAQ